jgi:hypothetical protein
MTIADMIKSSLRVCHVLAKGEAPSADEMQDAVQALQFMLDAWGADNLMIWGQVTEDFPLIAGQQDYTIGPSASYDFNTACPYKITDAYVRDGNLVDTGIDILTRTEFNSYNDKALSVTRPQALFYDQGLGSQTVQSGTIYMYPIPDGSSAYTLFIISQKSLLAITSSTQTFTLLAPYEEAVKYNLALRLWDEYHDNNEPIPQHIIKLAHDSKQTIERNSVEYDIAAMSIPGVKSGIWNILSDVENG